MEGRTFGRRELIALGIAVAMIAGLFLLSQEKNMSCEEIAQEWRSKLNVLNEDGAPQFKYGQLRQQYQEKLDRRGCASKIY